MTEMCTTPTPLRMATICSGIGAPEVASIGLPYEHVFMAEIEAFPSAILAHHWPHVPNLGDMTKIDGESYCGQVDVLVGGTPCQAFSVAGKRESLNDERGNLTLKFVELCDAINPAFVLWENVPGVLSTADNAFGCFLGALSGNDGELFPAGDGWSNAGCVIGPKRKLAWRILDAQYFGLAQRRRRVFVVACPRVVADPCEILFEREGVQRHSAPSREAGKGPAGTLESRSRAGGFHQNQRAEVRTGEAANTLNTDFNASGRNTPCVCFGGDVARTLQARHDSSPCADRGMDVVAIGWSEELTASEELAGTIQRGGDGGRHEGMMTPAMQVRRLTPIECERLQGFPDGYTAIPWRNKSASECPDGPRYKALGNSMAVPVMRWILRRIVDAE